MQGRSPFDLVNSFDYITLDTKWAALYNELERFESIADRIVNVHLRGKLEAYRWVLEQSEFSFYEAIDTISEKWKFAGPLTLEFDCKLGPSDRAAFLKAILSLP